MDFTEPFIHTTEFGFLLHRRLFLWPGKNITGLNLSFADAAEEKSTFVFLQIACHLLSMWPSEHWRPTLLWWHGTSPREISSLALPSHSRWTTHILHSTDTTVTLNKCHRVNINASATITAERLNELKKMHVQISWMCHSLAQTHYALWVYSCVGQGATLRCWEWLRRTSGWQVQISCSQ